MADSSGDNIGIDGTIKWCEDLAIDPEDVSLLAVACELKSPAVGEWTKSGFVEGWKRLGCVTRYVAYITTLCDDSGRGQV